MKGTAFLGVALKRLRNKAFLNIVLILAMALTVGVMVCIPAFSGAVSMRIMQQELAEKTKELNRPPFSVRYYCLPRSRQPITLDDADYTRDWLADMLEREVGLPVTMIYAQSESPTLHMRPTQDDIHYTGTDLATTQVVVTDDFADYIQIVEGNDFGEVMDPNALNVWILPSLANSIGINVGEYYELAYFFSANETPTRIIIAGFWEPLDEADAFWYRNPNELFRQALSTTNDQYNQFILPIAPEGTGFDFWYYVLDDSRMTLDKAQQYLDGLALIEEEVITRLPSGKMDYAPTDELLSGQERKSSLSVFLLGFSVPLVGILILFIAAISTMVVRFQAQETAVLVSRGTSRTQIIWITLIETLIVLVIAVPLGILLGLLLARLLGYSQGFMAFIQRDPLQVHLASVNWELVAAAVGINLLARIIPSFISANYSIVAFEQSTARRKGLKNVGKILGMLFITLVTAYAYRQLVQRGMIGITGWQSDDPLADPLLLLAPTLFLFVAPLWASELFALLMRPLALLGKGFKSITAYLGCLSLGREGGQYRTPIYLLVLCMGLGVFYASLAMSADIWLEDRLQYQVGADLTFEPGIEEEEDSEGSLGITQSDMAWLFPASDYAALEGVESASRVGQYTASTTLVTGDRVNLEIMAVERYTLPSVIYFRDDYAEQSLGEMMNALAIQSDGVILPSEPAELLGLEEGDEITINVLIDDFYIEIPFTIIGTYDYWPTVYPEDNSYTLIASLDYMIMITGGEFPHNIWLDLEPGADPETVLAEVRAMGIEPLKAKELNSLLVEDKDRLERVGLFGLFSISFIASAVLAGGGLLIYNTASMAGRTYRFAVLQAMGLKRREVVAMVSIEYVITLLYGMLVGAFVGIAGATLYVPYFPLSEGTTLPIPPFTPYVDWSATTWMAVIMAVSLLAIEGFILYRLIKTRVFEALRLGTRE